MPWIRQIHKKGCPDPKTCAGCGDWKGTVRTPAGRITRQHRLKGTIEKWARDLEDDVRNDDFIDPRKAAITVGEWWERCLGARHQERASRKRDESHWRNHVAPRWARTPLNTILKTDVATWVVAMQTAHRDGCTNPKRCPGCKVGAATIEGAVGVLRALFDQAIDAKILRDNPARGVKKPRRSAHVDRVLDAAEEQQLLDRLTELFGDRVDARLFVELMADTGVRWEEAAAIPPELVDTRRQRVHIAWVMERDGTARPYAKSEAGNRTVAYGDQMAGRIAAAKLAAPAVPGVFPPDGPGRLLFTSPGGGGTGKRKRGEPGVLWYTNWHRQVWARALTVEVATTPAPRVPGRPGPARRAVRRERYLEDPQPTPHDLRHTFGTRLADEGVPIHDIMALMGHADVRSAQRYMHSREERFGRAREALRRARNLTARQDRPGVTQESGS